MKLLLDQGLPRSAAALLTESGFDSVHVADIGLSKADDSEILQKALADEHVVVTLDADFHMLLALGEALNPSVIRIRIEGLKAAALTKLLLTVIRETESELKQGAAVTVDEDRIRLRLLPLIGNR